jgi:hypothetical protein
MLKSVKFIKTTSSGCGGRGGCGMGARGRIRVSLRCERDFKGCHVFPFSGKTLRDKDKDNDNDNDKG